MQNNQTIHWDFTSFTEGFPDEYESLLKDHRAKQLVKSVEGYFGEENSDFTILLINNVSMTYYYKPNAKCLTITVDNKVHHLDVDQYLENYCAGYCSVVRAAVNMYIDWKFGLLKSI